LKWRAQGDDFRTFLGDFVAALRQIDFPQLVATRALVLVLVFMLNLVPSSWAQTTSAPFMMTDLSIVVDITVGGKIRHFLLDTGCGLTVASADTAGWSPVDVMKAAPTHIIVWVDGSIHSMASTSATLEIGQTLIVTPVVVADLGPFSEKLKIKLDGILGQDVLSHFSRVTIDNKNKRLILEK
jgi:hypothetical protein